jgi:hypothetical protein
MRLLDDADVAHGGVLRHQQVERGYEQSSDLVVTYVWAGYVDSKPLSLKAALVREGDFCVKNGTIFAHFAIVEDRKQSAFGYPERRSYSAPWPQSLRVPGVL